MNKYIILSYSSQFKIALYSIIIVHFFGILGLAYSTTRPYFELATPFSLIITALALFHFQLNWNLSMLFYAGFCFLLGYFVEVVGVKTEVIFGTYQYGSTLGYQILDVPIIIGLNWLILAYSCGIISNKLADNSIIKALIGSLMMVLLDFVIEPVAIALDFWSWENNSIPYQNYVGWFITALLLQCLFHYLKFEKHNPLAKYVICVQAVFFICLQMII